MQNTTLNKNLIVVGGPTASGKTGLAIKIAKERNGEIINADSMQVYRYMDIGTNKGHLQLSSKAAGQRITIGSKIYKLDPWNIEDSGVVGWLFNITEPDDDFSVAEYQQLAYEAINNVWDRGKVPILVGGTGLYIDAVIKGYDINTTSNKNLRAKLNKLSIEELQDYMKDLNFDLNELNNSDRNNPRRLIRIIEKLKAGNISVAENTGFDATIEFYYPDFKREELMKKIEGRVQDMLDAGLIEEVQGLLDQGYTKHLKSMNSTGYKQVVEYLQGRLGYDELKDAIVLAHRQYAKRQITWFEGKGRGYNLERI